jgi:hypothetical protein
VRPLTHRDNLSLEVSALVNSRSRESEHKCENHTIAPNPWSMTSFESFVLHAFTISALKFTMKVRADGTYTGRTAFTGPKGVSEPEDSLSTTTGMPARLNPVQRSATGMGAI